MKKFYVMDTNVLLTEARSFLNYKNNDIVIPYKVLEEIDKHKKRQDGVGVNARLTIRLLDEYREKGSLHRGVRIGKGKGFLSIRGHKPELIPDGFSKRDPDNQIIGTAITLKKAFPNRRVILVSRDINMRVKCDGLELPCEDYNAGQVIENVDSLYNGFKKHLVDDQVIDQIYNDEEVIIEKEDGKFFANQFVMLVSSQNEKRTALARFISYNMPLKRVLEHKELMWGLKPRNKEQQFAMDLLRDESIPLVSIVGKAGCGKTLVAIAAGLHQVLDEGKYKKLVVSRPVQPMGKDIGFLPGTLEEKMKPWLMPIQDNMDFLLNGKKDSMAMFFENGTIEIEAITYIRGRSIANAFIIIDEAQNLTAHELKTIVTRAGENAKIVLTGDIEQIDNMYIDATTNGLSYAIEKFKDKDLAGHITLTRGERSKIATLAAKIL
jgi:PhoH-like ATPase